MKNIGRLHFILGRLNAVQYLYLKGSDQTAGGSSAPSSQVLEAHYFWASKCPAPTACCKQLASRLSGLVWAGTGQETERAGPTPSGKSPGKARAFLGQAFCGLVQPQAVCQLCMFGWVTGAGPWPAHSWHWDVARQDRHPAGVPRPPPGLAYQPG